MQLLNLLVYQSNPFNTLLSFFLYTQFPHRPNPYKNLTTKSDSSNIGIYTLSNTDQKSMPAYDRLQPISTSSIARTTKPNPYQR